MSIKTNLSSEWIYKFYKALDEHGIENHGLLIMQNGETVFEEYAYPYSADMPHTLFSVTKSIVSTAAGFAIDEGLFKLDTKIISLFPEYEACESDEWENITVRSVLTMHSNKEFSFLQDMTGNYAEMFMKAPFRKKDRGFLYSNNDAHMVAAIVQKTSGTNLVEYLTPRLFEPLGIEPPLWETNSIGECIGGTGAYLKLRDLAKICQCYADGGKYNGKQVIPEFWAKEAVKKQVPLSGRENEDGYGYLFWTEGDVFSMNGMFGQIVMYIPKYKAVIATLNSVVDDGKLARLLKTVLTKAFEETDESDWNEKLGNYLESRAHKPVANKERIDIPTGVVYRMTPVHNKLAGFMFPASLIPRSLTSSFAKRPKTNLDRVSFETDENTVTVRWYEEDDEVKVICGLDGTPRMSECSIKGYKYKIWAYAYSEDGKLNVVFKPLNTLSSQRFVFDFGKDYITIRMTGTPSFREFILKNASESSVIRSAPSPFRKIMVKTVDCVLSTIEMPLKYKKTK